MAKIDTSKIEGYENMTAEQKLAALEAYEYEDNTAEVDRLRNAVSKANSEAAEWKRKHRDLLSEDEQKKQADAEHLAEVEKQLAELQKEKKISDYTAQFISTGYDAKLAAETAKALAEGDTNTVFANQQKFMESYSKKLKADALRDTPRPPAGDPGNVDYAAKIDEARKANDMAAMAYYTRLQAQANSELNE